MLGRDREPVIRDVPVERGPWLRPPGNRTPAAAANQGTAACSIGTPLLPAAKSGLRRGGITRPTRRHVLMALFSTRRTVLRHITCDVN